MKAAGRNEWADRDRQDKRERLQTRKLAVTKTRGVLRNTDGLRKLRAIPDAQWEMALEADAIKEEYKDNFRHEYEAE